MVSRKAKQQIKLNAEVAKVEAANAAKALRKKERSAASQQMAAARRRERLERRALMTDEERVLDDVRQRKQNLLVGASIGAVVLFIAIVSLIAEPASKAEPADKAPTRAAARPAQVDDATTNLIMLNGVCTELDTDVAIMLHRDGAGYCYFED